MCRFVGNTLLAAAPLLFLTIATNAVAKPTEVEVVNAPDVNVVNTADVNVTNKPDVVVANTTPLNVLVTNDSAWREQYDDEKWNLDGSEVRLNAVPFGKQLHVEYLSAYMLIDPGKYVRCEAEVLIDIDQVTTVAAGGRHWLIMTGNSPAASGGQIWIASTPISLTIDEGEYLRVDCITNDATPSVHASITGYLVDMPAE
jgi:hypothetical protein